MQSELAGFVVRFPFARRRSPRSPSTSLRVEDEQEPAALFPSHHGTFSRGRRAAIQSVCVPGLDSRPPEHHRRVAMTIRTFAWIRLSRWSYPSETGERDTFQDTVSNSVPGEHQRRARFQQTGAGARAQSLLIASLCILVLVSLAPGAKAEEAIPAKDHRVKELLSSGGKHLRKKQVEQAIGQFKKAVSLNPQSAEAHMLLGYAYRVPGAIRVAR